MSESIFGKICENVGAGLGNLAQDKLSEQLLLLLKAIDEKLERIDRKVTLIQEGPYKTGVDLL